MSKTIAYIRIVHDDNSEESVALTSLNGTVSIANNSPVTHLVIEEKL